MKFNKLPAMCLALGFLAVAISAPTQAKTEQPNFLVVYGEGSGWVSTSVQMEEGNPSSKSDYIETPNLEKFAASGVTFSRGYAPSPRCTPSRAGLVTGKSPGLLHMTYVTESGAEASMNKAGGGKGNTKMIPPAPVLELPAAELTYAEVLQQAGYATAHFGKWHLGKVDPKSHGFDESDGPNDNQGPSGDRDANQDEYGLTADKGIEFMRRQVEAGKPFLLQVDHYPIMLDRNAADAMTSERLAMDDSFGQLFDTLQELDIADNTYVIFSTDHGTQGKNTPLSKGKGSVLEGGLRVPFIISGPSVRAGQWSDTPVSALDIFPTIAEVSGNKDKISAAVEGGSLAELLQDKDGAVQRSREEIYFHFPHYDKGNGGPANAMLSGDYKLIKVYENAQTLLYNIAEDPSESKNLAAAMPKLVAELDEKIVSYLEEIDAQMATFNADYAAK